MTQQEIETLTEIVRNVVKEEMVNLEHEIQILQEEVEYKFDIVFDELYTIRNPEPKKD